jgi:hypothetical protein
MFNNQEERDEFNRCRTSRQPAKVWQCLGILAPCVVLAQWVPGELPGEHIVKPIGCVRLRCGVVPVSVGIKGPADSRVYSRGPLRTTP